MCPQCEKGILYAKHIDETYMMRCNTCMFMLTKDSYEIATVDIRKEEYHIHTVEENLLELNNLDYGRNNVAEAEEEQQQG